VRTGSQRGRPYAGSGSRPEQPGVPNPATGTPALAPAKTVGQVRQLAGCGGVRYAVGSFTQISQGGKTFARDNVFSFGRSAPCKITSWAPSVNGTVNSIQLTSDCSHAFIGGKFTKVVGSAADNIAYIRT
jgi:hypothetical protein